MRRVRPRLAIVAALCAVVGGVVASATANARTQPIRQEATLRGTESVSSNWAGYVVRGVDFSHVAGTWTQPALQCAASARSESSGFWIGLGGASQGSAGLEQTGTAADCNRGRVDYYAWYEILPAPPTEIRMTIRPGDTISAEVDVANAVATFTMRNVTTGASFSRQAPLRVSAVESAEWIAEAPSECIGTSCTTVPLAHFGSVLFTAARATAATTRHTGTISDPTWFADAIRLSSRNGVLSATPSTLSTDGSSFAVATVGPRARHAFPGAKLRLRFPPR